MHLRSSVSALLLAATAFAAAAKTETQIIAEARAAYPLKACIVSDEAMKDMSEATPHIHRASGKPDRVIFVCCEGCIDDFKVDPAKFLKKLDDAVAKTAKEKKGEAKGAPPSKS